MKLYAPQEYWQASPELLRDICNGCGTKGIGAIVPDTIYGVDITAACNIHDWMYFVGSTITDKEEADRVFLNNMLRIIDSNGGWNWLQKLRVRRAYVYYQAVHIFGGPAFWKGKNPSYCEGPITGSAR